MDLRYAAQHQFVIGDIARNGGAGGDRDAVAYRDRGHQLSIRADKDIIANNRFMLVRTIVVAGDGARADIDVIANLRIAQIGQMTALEPFPRRAFFISTKLPTWAPASSSAPGRRRANGPMVQAACSWASSTTL